MMIMVLVLKRKDDEIIPSLKEAIRIEELLE